VSTTPDAVDECFNRIAVAFLYTRRRLGFLEATDKQILAVNAESERHGEPYRAMNDTPIIWALNDCFAKLVIDLDSIRLEIVKGRTSLFEVLGANLGRLRKVDPSEFPTPRHGTPMGNPGGQFSQADLERFAAENDRHFQILVAKGINHALERLFPKAPYPVTSAAVEKLRRRFEAATEALSKDRSKVRAHPFQRSFHVSYFLPLPEVRKHVEEFDHLLKDLSLVLHHQSRDFDAPWADGASESAGRDLADVVVFGGINTAANVYGHRQPRVGDTDHYWQLRERYFAEEKP
jgi:hypothetical protein